MDVQDIKKILNATVYCGEEFLEREVHTACGLLYENGLKGGCNA